MRFWLAILLTLVAVPLAAANDEQVREQRQFTIAGVPETWRLVWFGSPRDSKDCGPADTLGAMTCPCSGVAYAQVGDLMLERIRRGAVPERLPLTPLFAQAEMLSNEKQPVAMLPRWPLRSSDDSDAASPAAIRSRPAVPIMHLADYNHDGIAGEFLLQVDTAPCGKHVLVAIGVTRDNPHLHALTSAEHPEHPLALYQWEWEALARNPAPRRLVDWACGDHAAGEGTTMLLRAERGRLHATRLTMTCPDTYDADGTLHHDAHLRQRVVKREIL